MQDSIHHHEKSWLYKIVKSRVPTNDELLLLALLLLLTLLVSPRLLPPVFDDVVDEGALAHVCSAENIDVAVTTERLFPRLSIKEEKENK